MGRIGFEPPDHPEWEPDDAASEPAHVGAVGQLTVPKDLDEDDDGDELAEWTFKNHIYIAIQVGPFSLVLGRTE